jgi:hypothetical protein
MIITDWAVFEFIDGRLTLTELLPGATLEQVRGRAPAQPSPWPSSACVRIGLKKPRDFRGLRRSVRNGLHSP